MSLITGSGQNWIQIMLRKCTGMDSASSKKDAINYPDFNVGNHSIGLVNWIFYHKRNLEKQGPFSIYYGLGFDRRHYTQTDDVQILNTVADKANFETITT